MGVTQNYNRPKVAGTNVTGMDLSLLVAEKPDSPSAIGGTGTTGNLDCRLQCDADESGGADVQDLFKLETAISINASSGAITWVITVTPVKGGGTNGTPQVLTVVHDEVMDVWQSQAGRARQA